MHLRFHRNPFWHRLLRPDQIVPRDFHFEPVAVTGHCRIVENPDPVLPAAELPRRIIVREISQPRSRLRQLRSRRERCPLGERKTQLLRTALRQHALHHHPRLLPRIQHHIPHAAGKSKVHENHAAEKQRHKQKKRMSFFHRKSNYPVLLKHQIIRMVYRSATCKYIIFSIKQKVFYTRLKCPPCLCHSTTLWRK